MAKSALVDAGFLVALLSRRDANHGWAAALAASLGDLRSGAVGGFSSARGAWNPKRRITASPRRSRLRLSFRRRHGCRPEAVGEICRRADEFRGCLPCPHDRDAE